MALLSNRQKPSSPWKTGTYTKQHGMRQPRRAYQSARQTGRPRPVGSPHLAEGEAAEEGGGAVRLPESEGWRGAGHLQLGTAVLGSNLSLEGPPVLWVSVESLQRRQGELSREQMGRGVGAASKSKGKPRSDAALSTVSWAKGVPQPLLSIYFKPPSSPFLPNWIQQADSSPPNKQIRFPAHKG